MEKEKLSALAETLLQSKVASLRKEGEAKKKKGLQGLVVFSLLFGFFFIGGIAAGLIHGTIVMNGTEIDFHEIGQYLCYAGLGLSVICLIFYLAYFSLYKEGKKALAEVARINEGDHSSSSR
jgi:hypothetical protein